MRDMRTSTLVLSLTTATFAMTTAWLAWQLHQFDDTPAAVEAARAAPGLVAPDLAARPAERSTPHAAPGAPGAPGEPGKSSPTPARAHEGAADIGTASAATNRDDAADPSIAFARQTLAKFADSAQRDILLEGARSSVRRQYSRLREQLGLGDTKFEQLVTLLAEQNLQGQETWARCAVDPDCNPSKPPKTPIDDRSQELLALLGAENMDEFTRYRETLGERDAVAQFRGRLADSQFLPQSQADQLIAALADERKRYADEAYARGARLSGWGTNLGMIMYPQDAGSIEAQLAEAAVYSQRMRDRAAALLTPAQLAEYVRMQEELLAQMASYLRPTPRKTTSQKLARS
jgi:hypothetical protein